jgi:hypothetical protein
MRVCFLVFHFCQVLRAPLFAGLDWQALASGQLVPPFVPPVGTCAVSPGTSYAALTAYSEAVHDPETLPQRPFGYSRGHGSDSQLLPQHATSTTAELNDLSGSIDSGAPRSEHTEIWSMDLPVVPLSPALAPGLLPGQQQRLPVVASRSYWQFRL